MSIFIETLLRKMAELIVLLIFSQIKKTRIRRLINKVVREIFHNLRIVGVEIKIRGW